MTTLEFSATDAAADAGTRPLSWHRAVRRGEAGPDPALWPARELDRAIGTLILHQGKSALAARSNRSTPERLSLDAVRAVAKDHGWQAEAGDLDDAGARRGPMLLPAADGSAFLVVLRKRGKRATVLSPDGRRLKRTLIELELLLGVEPAGVPQGSSAVDIPQYLKDRLHRATRVAPGCYRLVPSPPDRLSRELRSAGLPTLGLLLLALLVAAEGLEILGWGVFGGAVLNGARDAWGMIGWLLLLATLHLMSMPIHRVQSELTLRAGGVIKRRLQRGALAMDLDHMRRLGPSALMSRTIEAQALEQSGLGALLMNMTALVELATAALVCIAGAAGVLQLGWMACLLAAIAAAAVPYFRSLSRWTEERREQASQLAESIAGHRSTRLQLHPLRRANRIDGELASYVLLSRRTDRWARWMLLGLPSLWTLGSVATLVPASLANGLSATGVAVSIGATLLGARALNTTVSGLAATFRARLAWLQLGDLLRAAGPVPEPEVPAARQLAGHRLLDVSFRHPERNTTVLDRVTLELGNSDKILLTGASGSGKSTLGALLTGLREPSSGRLDIGGRSGSLPSMAAPQAQENHIFSATLAENLFLAKIGALDPADETRALEVLARLELGDLLARMPLGLFQRVGSGGWALSQGEKSRICVARALLADADLVVLDESFGPLDPATAKTCLEAARQLSRSLLVIAHP